MCVMWLGSSSQQSSWLVISWFPAAEAAAAVAEAAAAVSVVIGTVPLVQQYSKSTAVCTQHYIPGKHSVTVAATQSSGYRTASPAVVAVVRNRNGDRAWIS